MRRAGEGIVPALYAARIAWRAAPKLVPSIHGVGAASQPSTGAAFAGTIEPVRGTRRTHSAARGDDRVVSFSGAGWLSAFHLGAASVLLRPGGPLVLGKTPLAGTSGGAIVAGSMAAGVTPDALFQVTRDIARDCREHGTLWRSLGVLRRAAAEVLPTGAFQAAQRTGVTITATRVFPSPSAWPQLISSFEDDDDFINAIIASCYLPAYLSPRPTFRWRGCEWLDGGLKVILPPLPPAERPPIQVSAISPSILGITDANCIISPDVLFAESKGSKLGAQYGRFADCSTPRELLVAMLKVCLTPADDNTQHTLWDMGVEAAERSERLFLD